MALRSNHTMSHHICISNRCLICFPPATKPHTGKINYTDYLHLKPQWMPTNCFRSRVKQFEGMTASFADIFVGRLFMYPYGRDIVDLHLFDIFFPKYQWNSAHLNQIIGRHVDNNLMDILKFLAYKGVKPELHMVRNLKYIKNEQLFDWLLAECHLNPDVSLANWFATVLDGENSYDISHYHRLLILWNKSHVLPSCHITWPLGHLEGYVRGFSSELYNSQARITLHMKQHTRLINLCIALFDLHLPSYVLLWIFDWIFTGKSWPMTEYQKIGIIVNINETHRKRRLLF